MDAERPTTARVESVETGTDAKVVSGKVKLHRDCLGPFASALEAVAVNSFYGNRKHNVDHSWRRGRPDDYLDAAVRHLAHAREYDGESGLIHLVPAAWNCLAALSLLIGNGGEWNREGADANGMMEHFEKLHDK